MSNREGNTFLDNKPKDNNIIKSVGFNKTDTVTKAKMDYWRGLTEKWGIFDDNKKETGIKEYKIEKNIKSKILETTLYHLSALPFKIDIEKSAQEKISESWDELEEIKGDKLKKIEHLKEEIKKLEEEEGKQKEIKDLKEEIKKLEEEILKDSKKNEQEKIEDLKEEIKKLEDLKDKIHRFYNNTNF